MIELAVFLLIVLVIVLALWKINGGLHSYSARPYAKFFATEEDRKVYEAAEAEVIGTKSPSAWNDDILTLGEGAPMLPTTPTEITLEESEEDNGVN